METITTKVTPLFTKLKRLRSFAGKYDEFPAQEGMRLAEQMKSIADTLQETPEPTTMDELLVDELKRRLNLTAASVINTITAKPQTFDDHVVAFGIHQDDLYDLPHWLRRNREITLDSIERLFSKYNDDNDVLEIPTDRPSRKREAEATASVLVRRYHRHIGTLIQRCSRVGGFLREVQAEPTTEGRSYFDPKTLTIALGIPAICYLSRDDTLHPSERELIRLLGHEGMGHALQHVITKASGLPHFMDEYSTATIASDESVTQFMERQIFEDLRAAKDIQKELCIDHKFESIYQDAKDRDQLNSYHRKQFHYALTVLADKSLGNPEDTVTIQKKIDLLEKVALSPRFAQNIMEQLRRAYDSRGNLDSNVAGEIRYASRVVEKALKVFEDHGILYTGEGRSVIDETFLTGFWTPKGFLSHAKIRAREYEGKVKPDVGEPVTSPRYRF